MNSPEWLTKAKIMNRVLRVTGSVAVVSAGILQGVNTVEAATGSQDAGNPYTCSQLMDPTNSGAVRGVNPDGSPKYYQDDPLRLPENRIYCVTDPNDGTGTLTHGNPSSELSVRVDQVEKKRIRLTYYDVVNRNAKLGETGYDYGVIAYNEMGTNIIHRVAGYYHVMTYDSNSGCYVVNYYPIQVSSEKSHR